MSRPDVIWRTLELVMQSCELLTQEAARSVERQARAEFGGLRVEVPKTPYRADRGFGTSAIPAEKAAAVMHDIINQPHTSTDTLVRRHGVSRATIYRLMKRGPAGA